MKAEKPVKFVTLLSAFLTSYKQDFLFTV